MTDSHGTMELVDAGVYEDVAGSADPAQSPFRVARRLLRGRLRWAIGLAVVLAGIGGVAGYKVPVPIYQSRALVEIAPQVTKILYENEENSLLPMFEQFVAGQAALAQERRVIDTVVRTPEWKALGKGATDADIVEFERNLSVARVGRTFYLQIAYTDENPVVAQTAVNQVLSTYLALVKESDKDGGAKRRSELLQLKQSLGAEISQKRREELVQTGGLGPEVLAARHGALTEEIAGIDGMINELAIEIATLEHDSEVADEESGEVPADTAPQIIAADPLELARRDVLLAQLIRDKEQAVLRVEVLRDTLGLGTSHPQLIAATRNVEQLQRQIAARVQAIGDEPVATENGAVAPAADPVAAMKAAVERRERFIELRMEKARELKKQAEAQLRLATLKQEREIVEDQLASVKVRLEALDLEARMGGRIGKVSDAERPVAPFKDRRIQFAVLGGLGGVGAGFGLVILIGLLAARMRHFEDMRGHEKQGRFLALVPEVAGPDEGADSDGGAEMSDYCVHHLRTMLQLHANGDSRTIAFTSPSPGAGKTTVGLAVGLSFGAAGTRTLIVDCDLVGRGLTSAAPSIVREAAKAALEATASFDTLDIAAVEHNARSQVRRAFASRRGRADAAEIDRLLLEVREASDLGSSRARSTFRALEAVAQYERLGAAVGAPRPGILDVLGGAPLEECVLDTGFANLSILPVGEATSSDAECLSPAHFARLADVCKENYDTVIFDTGPVLGSLEAAFVSAVADEVVFVVSRGQPRRLASEALERLDRIGAKVSGIVFNRASANDLRSSSYASRSPSMAVGAA